MVADVVKPYALGSVKSSSTLLNFALL